MLYLFKTDVSDVCSYNAIRCPLRLLDPAIHMLHGRWKLGGKADKEILKVPFCLIFCYHYKHNMKPITVSQP